MNVDAAGSGVAADGGTVFHTARLRCRRWMASDLDPLLAVYGDPDAMRWVGDGQPLTAGDAGRWWDVTTENYARRGYGMYALEDLDSGEVVGFCGLVHPGGQAEAEIKYALRRDCWGRGLASEVAVALLAHAHGVLGLTRVIATVAAPHLASRRVLEKAGMRLNARRDETDGSSTLVYEWRSLSSAQAPTD